MVCLPADMVRVSTNHQVCKRNQVITSHPIPQHSILYIPYILYILIYLYTYLLKYPST